MGYLVNDSNEGNDYEIEMGTPTPQAALVRMICQAVNNGNDTKLDTLTQELSSMEVDNDDNDGTSFDAGDSLGKALTFIEQVCPLVISLYLLIIKMFRSESHLKLAHLSKRPARRRECPSTGVAAVGQNLLGFII